MKKTEVYFNKPIYVGQAILDLSKTHMFDFHYNYIRDKFGDKAELLFTDTDSLMYLIQTEDFYQDINNDIKRKFDTSDYPEKHPSGIKTGINKKVIGKFKDAVGGKQITHFVGLRPKLYSFEVEDNSETRKAKGVKKNVIKNALSFEDYKNCLFSEEEVMKDMNIIRSKNHDIYSMRVNKLALSASSIIIEVTRSFDLIISIIIRIIHREIQSRIQIEKIQSRIQIEKIQSRINIEN